MLVPRPRGPVLFSPIARSKVLVVEGETPAHFFEAFLKRLGISDEIEVRSFAGNSQLGTYLKTLAVTTEFSKVSSLGIARDAEVNHETALQAAKKAVSNASIKIPVEYFIFPDNQSAGNIETKMLRSVSSDPVIDHMEQFIQSAIKIGKPLPDGYRLDKHKMQIFLATCVKCQVFPGIAAEQGAFPLEHSSFADIEVFLKKL